MKQACKSLSLFSKWVNKHVKCSVAHYALSGVKAAKKEEKDAKDQR
jgi:hypothetical protein